MTVIELVTKQDLNDFKIEFLTELKKLLSQSASPQQREWIRSSEVRKMLKISAGTLQNLRINRTLNFTKMGKIFYYRFEDINRILEQHLSKSNG